MAIEVKTTEQVCERLYEYLKMRTRFNKLETSLEKIIKEHVYLEKDGSQCAISLMGAQACLELLSSSGRIRLSEPVKHIGEKVKFTVTLLSK